MSVEVSNKGWMWIVAGSVTVLALALLLVLQASVKTEQVFDDLAGNPASDLSLYCMHGDQCERPGSKKLMVELENTLSNLGYLLFGVCVAVRSLRPGAGAAARPSQMMFGLGLCFLAVCSAWYHGSLNGNSTVSEDGKQILLDLATGFCTGGKAKDFDDTPQVWDIMGVYLAMMMLVLHGVDHALKKDISLIRGGTKLAAALLGSGLVVATVVVCGLAGALPDSAGVVVLMVILSAFVLGARYAGREGLAWLSWIVWAVVWLVCAFLAHLMKTKLGWGSEWVFGTLAGCLAAVLLVNWMLSGLRLPGPEFIALLAVFIMGIVPRLVDGYDVQDPAVKDGLHVLVIKDFCSPEGPVQAHALWHLMSALALILVYDLLEKSRGDGRDISSSTVLLPQDRRLDDGLRLTLPNQPPLAVLFNVGLTVAALVLLIVFIASFEKSGAAFLVMAAVPLACAGILWLWPLIRGEKD